MSAEAGLPADVDPAALGEIGDTAALEALAVSIAGAARSGEQLEVCISRGRAPWSRPTAARSNR
ncbi:MAG: hypothetical protein R2690_06025 [Acidimicrobiales bacterium]